MEVRGRRTKARGIERFHKPGLLHLDWDSERPSNRADHRLPGRGKCGPLKDIRITPFLRKASLDLASSILNGRDRPGRHGDLIPSRFLLAYLQSQGATGSRHFQTIRLPGSQGHDQAYATGRAFRICKRLAAKDLHILQKHRPYLLPIRVHVFPGDFPASVFNRQPKTFPRKLQGNQPIPSGNASHPRPRSGRNACHCPGRSLGLTHRAGGQNAQTKHEPQQKAICKVRQGVTPGMRRVESDRRTKQAPQASILPRPHIFAI